MSRKAVRRLCIAAGIAVAMLVGTQVANAAPPGTNNVAAEAAACASL